MNLLRASVFDLKRLHILRNSIANPNKMLFSFDYAQSFCSQFRASRYITGLNRTSEQKVIVVGICSEHLFSISSVSIYYGTQSYIRVKSYCGLHLLRASVFNSDPLDILRDSVRHPIKIYCCLNFLGVSVFNFERLDIL